MLVQLTYTTVFGWHASWTLLSTGCTASAVAVHVACNMFGFPDFECMRSHQLSSLLMGCLFTGLAGFVALYSTVLGDVNAYSNKYVLVGQQLGTAQGFRLTRNSS